MLLLTQNQQLHCTNLTSQLQKIQFNFIQNCAFRVELHTIYSPGVTGKHAKKLKFAA